MNIKDYGFDYEINSNETIGTPARITAVHKGRFAIVSDFGDGYAQLKGKEVLLPSKSNGSGSIFQKRSLNSALKKQSKWDSAR